MDRAGELTDHEGSLLALIQRKGPLSAYQIAKDYESSPIYTINTAKGKLYPLLERLVERALLKSEEMPHDRRGTKHYGCTDRGRSALRLWLNSFRPEHELPPDPLRRKLQALDLLAPQEQLAWIKTVRMRLLQRLEAVQSFDADAEGGFSRFAQSNAAESLRGRLRWLDELQSSIGGDLSAKTQRRS